VFFFFFRVYFLFIPDVIHRQDIYSEIND